MDLKNQKVNKILFAETLSDYYYPYQNWYFPLKRACKEIVNFDTRFNFFKYGKDLMNKKFLGFIKKEKPDYIFMWVRNDEFYLETLLKIREISPKTQTLLFFGDDDAAFENFSRYYILFLDYGLIAQYPYLNEYKKEGHKNVFFTIGIDTHFFHPLEIEKKYDVTFIGHPKTKESERYETIKFLKENGVKIKLFGWGWENYPEFKEIYGGPLNSNEMVKVINQSKIHICFSKNHYGIPHIKGKFFEGSACKTFVLTEFYNDYKRLYKEGKEIVFFNNKQELLEKIKYYLSNEKKREKIAEAAYRRTVKDYSLDNDLKKIFQKIKKNKRHSSLPKLNGKLIILDEKDFLSKRKLFEKLEHIDYIQFSNKNSEDLHYRDYLQIYSLNRTKKSISCCDYYVYKKSLGDYLRFSTERLMNVNPKNLPNFLDINQLMIKKEFFIKNYNLLEDIFFNQKKINFLNEENTSIISFPLIRLKKPPISNSKIMPIAYDFNFLYDLYSFKNTNKKKFLSYSFSLFLEVIKGKWFILKAIWDILKDKSKGNKTKSLNLS